MYESGGDALGVREGADEMELEAALVAVGQGGHPLHQARHTILAHTVNLMVTADINSRKKTTTFVSREEGVFVRPSVPQRATACHSVL